MRGSGDVGRRPTGSTPRATTHARHVGGADVAATACGLPERLHGYLRAQQVLSAGLMSAMADSYQEIDELLFKPLVEGIEIEGTEWKVTPTEAQ